VISTAQQDNTPHPDSWDGGQAVEAFPDDATLATIEAAAREFIAEAGKIVLASYGGPLEIEYKNTAKTDPVTATDKAVEAYLTGAVRDRFPDHAVLGEEGQDPDGEHEFEWIVDPIDGTINFVNRLPFFVVSIGVLHRRRPVVGAILFPVTGETLHAHRGGGAFRDGVPIRVHAATEPSGRVTVAASSGYVFTFKTARAARRIFGEARSVGSIAYELGLVASGGFGWAIFRGPKIWDVAGGLPIITEAGGVALRYSQRDKGWVPLDRFEAPPQKSPDKPTKLRDWGAPVIVGAAPLVNALAPHIEPRRLPVILTAAMKSYRGWRRWIPKKEPPPAAPDPPGEAQG